MSAAPVLTILRNGETVKTLPIVGEAVLGRAEGCVIRLEDRAISRQHAVFRAVPEGVQVEKRSEFAPLMVNGAECTRAVIRLGDVISIGPYLLKLSPQASERAEAPAAAPAVPSSLDATAVLESPSKSQLPELALAEPQDIPAAASADAGAVVLSEIPVLEPPIEPLPGAAPQDAEVAPLPALDPPAEVSQSSIVEMAPDDAVTKVSAPEKVAVRLIFKPGQANVESFEFTKDEISIGRGKSCDIVLNDKKSSRKNTLIRRAGLQFVIKDLSSANGTFVNGERITEQELPGEAMIRIGDVDFEFKATSADYEAKQRNFLSVPAEQAEPEKPFDYAIPADFGAAPDQNALVNPNALVYTDAVVPATEVPGAAPSPTANATTIPGIAGIPGISGVGGAGGKRATLMERFRAQPKPRQYMIIVLVVALLYFLLFDEEPQPVKKTAPQPKPSAAAVVAKRNFESLTPDQQKFVREQHELAFDYYRNKDYDKALFEITKIFSLVDDYLNSREIERYAKEGKRKREAIEEEKRRKDEEARLKAKILQLEDEARERMAKKEYEQARELFAQILALDPENQSVEKWRAELEEFEEAKRVAQEQKLAQAEINNQAWAIYKEGVALTRRGKYHSAISVFDRIKEVGATDRRVLKYAERQILKARYAIKRRREPVLEQARQAEGAGEFASAYKLFEKATRVDPPHPEGYAGMKRVRGVLHDRAKILYTEAVLAESYSDFGTAKKKYQEIVSTAPKDDIYFERAERKLARYFRKDEVVQ